MLQYFSQLNVAEQQSVLNMIKTFIKSRNFSYHPNGDFNALKLEDYNKELEEANPEIESGDFVTHEEVKKRFLG